MGQTTTCSICNFSTEHLPSKKNTTVLDLRVLYLCRAACALVELLRSTSLAVTSAVLITSATKSTSLWCPPSTATCGFCRFTGRHTAGRESCRSAMHARRFLCFMSQAVAGSEEELPPVQGSCPQWQGDGRKFAISKCAVKCFSRAKSAFR